MVAPGMDGKDRRRPESEIVRPNPLNSVRSGLSIESPSLHPSTHPILPSPRRGEDQRRGVPFFRHSCIHWLLYIPEDQSLVVSPVPVTDSLPPSAFSVPDASFRIL